MRALAILAVLVLGLGGCWLDGPTGIVHNEDGTTTYDPAKDVVGSTLKTVRDTTSGSPISTGASIGLTLLAAWQWLRARGAVKALAVTVEGVEAFANTDAGKTAAPILKDLLALRHEVAGVTKIIAPLVDKFGHPTPTPAPAT